MSANDTTLLSRIRVWATDRLLEWVFAKLGVYKWTVAGLGAMLPFALAIYEALPLAVIVALGALTFAALLWATNEALRLHDRLRRPRESDDDDVLIHDAARIAYEATERTGMNDFVSGNYQTAEEKLTYFMYSFMSADLPMKGKRPPSTQALPIPPDQLSRFHPVDGASTLRSDFAAEGQVYHDVTIKRGDMNRHIAHLRAIADQIAE